MSQTRFEQRVFTVEERKRVQARLLEIAHADSRIVAGALLGSLAKGAGDHAVLARICIERARYWQAEQWITGIREEALTLACRRLGLELSEARGYDKLSPELLARASATPSPCRRS